MRIRSAAVLCTLAVAASAIGAEQKPGTSAEISSTAAQASVAKSLLPAAPDLVVHLKEYPQKGMAYPYQSFWVENKGTAPSPATTAHVTCTAYKGNAVYGPCSSTGKLPVPALPVPTKPNDPAAMFSPNLPFSYGPVQCDRWDDKKKEWAGITKCVMVAVVDPDHLVANDSHKSNNTVTITIPAH
jgi:hypothetical protein